MYRKLTTLSTYTAHATTIIFVVGFLFDMFILPDINDPIARYIGVAYLSAVALLIMFREWLVSRNTASQMEQRLYSIATFGIAYFSGSALSFVFIYALRSAALSVSWPLFLILLICMIANEYVATHNYRFTLDVGVLLIATLFYTVFNIPILLKTQNDITFAIGIGVSIIISLAYIYLLKYMSETAYDEAPRAYALAIGIPMFVGMLYFLNVLPAVPLSLKDAGVYHGIIKTMSGDYIAKEESDPRFLARFRTSIYHLAPTDTGIYFFSAVNAPVELTAPITHVWEYYDNQSKRWVESTRVSFTLAGGRSDGYRAYSLKENLTEGLWRVTVKVDQSRIVGRLKFNVVKENHVETKEVKL
jgi:hypothetical protein